MTERGAARAALWLLLLVALAWRVNNIAFGLPGMYDPDEPMFMLTALKLPLQGTLNPGWFGHPGTTTIYMLALIDIVVVAVGLLSGSYSNIAEFTAAAYANPAIVFIPSRLLMVALGVTSVWLTYVLGKRLVGEWTGIIAAALLTFNGLHISWSQVIRTDIHASVFMLGALIFAVDAAKHGRLKHWLLAGFLTGFATATKWPAASVIVAVAGAWAYRRTISGAVAKTDLRTLAAAIGAAIIGLFIASPYIFLDWSTVLSNVTGEMSSGHLGHSGTGFFSNLMWYIRHQLVGTMGWIGLFAATIGMAHLVVVNRLARFTMMPASLAFLGLICAQNLVWSRWILPVMPMFCIFVAAAATWTARALSERAPKVPRKLAYGAIGTLALAPSIAGAFAQSAERANDTRSQAVLWAKVNIPAGSSVVLEHLELNLREQPWRILFPMGEAGCVDAVQLLKNGVRYDEVQKLRRGSPIVDLGNVSQEQADSCRADYAILTYYDLYQLEAAEYPRQVRSYQKILAGGRTVALFAPRPGQAGGPVVRIVAVQ
jgi:hypothetical protein